jgi:hypothetical protein
MEHHRRRAADVASRLLISATQPGHVTYARVRVQGLNGRVQHSATAGADLRAWMMGVKFEL